MRRQFLVILILSALIAGSAYELRTYLAHTRSAPLASTRAGVPGGTAVALGANTHGTAGAQGGATLPPHAIANSPAAWASVALLPSSAPAVDAATRADKGGEAHAKALRDAIQAFGSLTPEQKRDLAEVLQALVKLREANGSPVMGNINLDVLKNNLLIGQKMQAIADNLKVMGTASGAQAASDAGVTFAQQAAMLHELSAQVRSPLIGMPDGAPGN